MRGLTRFEKDELVTIDGVDHHFLSLVPSLSGRADDPDDLQFVHARNRRAKIFTPSEFLTAYHAGLIVFHRVKNSKGDVASEQDNAPQALKRRWRHFWTCAYDRDPVKKSSKKLGEFIEQYRDQQPDPIDPPSPETLRTWLRMRGSENDRRPRNMGDRRRVGSSRRERHPIIEAIWEDNSKKYWSNYKVTKADVFERVARDSSAVNDERARLGKRPLRTLGRTTMWRRLQQERTHANVCSREGRQIADRHFKAIKGSLEAKRILDIAIIDQKRMDVHILDDTRSFLIGRPWMAALIDVKSRMILGYTLTWEDPSVLSAMACIRMALKGAPDLKAEFPSVMGKWESFGVPRTIKADNAWENVGSSFQDACEDHAISIDWAPVRQPEYKGILERFFRTLDLQLVHKLPGAVTDTPTNLAKRGIDPQVDATLTLVQLEAFVAEWIVDVYSTSWHDNLNAAPLQVWRDRAGKDGIELAHDLTTIDSAMGTLVPDRRLTREGVEFLGLHYCSDAVDSLLADLLPYQPAGIRTGSAVVKIKYHPEDLSRIFVWNDRTGRYVTLPCTKPLYAKGLSVRVHKELSSRNEAAHDDFVTEMDACDNKAKLLKNIADSYQDQSVKDRRRSARMTMGAVAQPTEGNQVPQHFPVHTLNLRVDANNPDKAAVRTKSSPRRKTTRSSSPPPEPARQIAIDPFADVNWAEEAQRSGGVR